MEADATRVLVGLDEYVVLGAVEVDDELVVTVAVPRLDAACPRCGVFSCRVKHATTILIVGKLLTYRNRWSPN